MVSGTEPRKSVCARCSGGMAALRSASRVDRPRATACIQVVACRCTCIARICAANSPASASCAALAELAAAAATSAAAASAAAARAASAAASAVSSAAAIAAAASASPLACASLSAASCSINNKSDGVTSSCTRNDNTT